MPTVVSHPSIPIELMEILNSINDNVNKVRDDVHEVKNRMTALEAQNHAENFKNIWNELNVERDKRIELEIKVATLTSKLAPILIGISVIGAGLVDIIGRFLIR